MLDGLENASIEMDEAKVCLLISFHYVGTFGYA